MKMQTFVRKNNIFLEKNREKKILYKFHDFEYHIIGNLRP